MTIRNAVIVLLSGVVSVIAVVGVVFAILAYERVLNADAQLRGNNAQLKSIVSTLSRDSSNQLANRVSNVAVWCSAINDQRDYARYRVTHVTHQSPYTLADLNCKQLEVQTAKSAK